VFFQGAIICILNPKAWLFIFATYPQFMKSDDGPLWPQGLLMGSMTAFVQLIVYGGWH
jgi:threonine/homoserine/homoserine lactone efflux protein